MDAQPYPFTKNRYFQKKRLRAADFLRDQTFADSKLAFLSHWLFGAGAALGLGVQRVDSDSLLVEPGFAVDPGGRLVIVDEPALRRLRTLEGFRELTGETAVLWLRYAEQELEPMLVGDGGGEHQEFSVARESFDLFLTSGTALPVSEAERALCSRFLLYEDDELRVTQCIPRLLSGRRPTHLCLDVECFSPEPVEAAIRYTPQISGFAGAELSERLRLTKGEVTLKMPVRPVSACQTVCIRVEEGDFLLEKRGERKSARAAFREEFPVTADEAERELAERLTALSTGELWDAEGRGVPIAALRLVRSGEKALLDDVISLETRRRPAVPWLTEELRRCRERFWPGEANASLWEQGVPTPASSENTGAAAPRAPERPETSTGTVTLTAGLHMGDDDVLRSDELSHGLGPGTVFVDFGVENVCPVANKERNRTEFVLGDASLFEEKDLAEFDRGVRLHPEKGTFELALRLHGPLRRSSIQLRWFAWKPESGENGRSERPTGTLLRLEPDLLRVKPGENVHFTPIFAAGMAAPCDFTAEGRRSGAVTRDGLYTAPESPGLYQIRAHVRGRPEECAEAFVIVEEEGDGPEGV